MSIAALSSINSAASATDIDLLVRYLIPVFLAQDFAEACRAADPDFLTELPHGAQSVDEASSIMKAEITNGLDRNEAAAIVLSAANTALLAAKSEVGKLSPDYPRVGQSVLKQWCHTNAKPYLLNVLKANEKGHQEFLKIISKAKASGHGAGFVIK
jgi:hypothetical protein